MASGLTELNQIHKREDVLDMISLVDEKATPFMNMVRKGSTPQNTFLQWTVDRYDAPSLGGVVDGEDVTAFDDKAKNRAILATYLQTFRNSAKVSRLAQDVSNVAGVSSEIQRAVKFSLKEHNRSIEATLLSDQEHQVENGSDPYLTRGLGTWIDGTQSTFPVPDEYQPPADQKIARTLNSFNEDNIQNVLQSVYDNTGMIGNYTFLVGSELRRRFTDMTRYNSVGASVVVEGRRVNVDNDKKIINTVAMYEGDFGSVRIMNSNWIGFNSQAAPEETTNKNRGFLIDTDKVVLRVHKQPAVEFFADNGGGPRFMIESRCALTVLNPIALAGFKLT